MQPKTVAKPGEPPTIPLLTSGPRKAAALFTRHGEPMAYNRCEPHTMGEAIFDCYLFENLPEGGYWGVNVIAFNLSEAEGGKTPNGILVSFYEVGREIGVHERTVSNALFGLPDENECGNVERDRRMVEHLTETLDEAEAPESVKHYVAEVLKTLA